MSIASADGIMAPRRLRWAIALAAVAAWLPARADNMPASPPSSPYVVRHESWSARDEKDWRDFIAALGESDCDTLDSCLRGPANPYRGSDPPHYVFQSDCADLPYVLRFYFAWKRGLPFSFASAVRSRGETRDIRYSPGGNEVVSRLDVPSNTMSGTAILEKIRDAVSSATYRIHPDRDVPYPPDLYSPRIDPASIGPGTAIYDPAGHVGIVYRVEPNGRVHFFDAHTDFSLTAMTYDLRFARAPPSVGAGFKNWRPLRLVGATRRADGILVGGHVVVAPNKDIADFSDEQFFGNGARPRDEDWKSGTFALGGERLDYYDYVRARLAGGTLLFDPIAEIGDMLRSNCIDLRYRAQAVERAIAAGIQTRPEPGRLPENIYGAEGEWETYSTPSRDARLKTAFKALRDTAQRFVEMAARRDGHLSYVGPDLAGTLLSLYDRETARCRLSYARGDGTRVTLGYEDVRKRLFAMSFDPYQCVERRWGATEAGELATCLDDSTKRAWYDAERNLRNQIERTYEARMDFTREELETPGPGKGAALPPDTDTRAYLAGAGHDAQPAADNAP